MSRECVCDPRHVCTLPMYFGLSRSAMSKMRMPRMRSLLTVSLMPVAAQSSDTADATTSGARERRSIAVTEEVGSWNVDAQRQRREHLLHAHNFSGLIDVDVRRELEDEFVLPGARRGEQRADHADRAS